jgi:hypothetical protein
VVVVVAVADAGGVGGDLRRTDKWDILSHSSVRHHGCSMLADAGGDGGGEAWTCAGQTNGIFYPIRLSVNHGCSMVADAGGDGGLATDRQLG